MAEQRIYNLSTKLNDEDRQKLASILYKAGYKVWQEKEQIPGKKTNIIYTAFEPVEDSNGQANKNSNSNR